MTKTERVVAGQLRAVRADEFLPDERHQLRPHVRLVGRQGFDAAPVEDLPLDRPALQHASLGRLELIEARRKERLDRRWHHDVAVGRFGDHRQHLLHEERVALRGLSDPRADRIAELGVPE